MAKKQRVIKIAHDEVANTATLILACSHTFKIEGWKTVMSLGPLDIAERECRECEYEGDFSRVDTQMVNLRERIVHVMEKKMEGFVQTDTAIDLLETLDDLLGEAIAQLGERFGNEAHSWKQGSVSLRAKILKLAAQARGDQ